MSLAARPALLTAALSLLAVIAYVAWRAAGVAELGDTAVQAPAVAIAVTNLAPALPEIVLDDLDGVPTALSSWPGTPLVVNFWATWCAPCLREIPLLKAFQDANPQIQVVGIAIDSLEPVREFAAEMAFNYPVLVGPRATAAAAAFGIDYLALPLTVFVGADSAVLGAHIGELRPEHLANVEAVFTDLAAAATDNDAARARLARRR